MYAHSILAHRGRLRGKVEEYFHKNLIIKINKS